MVRSESRRQRWCLILAVSCLPLVAAAAAEAPDAAVVAELTQQAEAWDRAIVRKDLVIDPYTVEDFSVRLYGDVALLSGRTRMTGRSGESPFQTHYRYIDIYVRRDGRWQVCSVQISKIPPPPGE
jgi:ketosteroid isomerase-like protein